MKYLFLILALFLLPACGRETKKPLPELVVSETQVPYYCGEPPAADSYKAQHVKWQVYTIEGVNFYALDAEGFGALMSNLAKLLTSSRQSKDRAAFYADCITRAAKAAPPPATSTTVTVTPEPEKPGK